METQKTVLGEAKEWLESVVEIAEDGEVVYDAVTGDDVVLLARLTTCSEVFPGTTRTYGQIAEEIADNEGGLTYVTDEADELPGCEVESSDSECSRCHQTTARAVCSTTDRRLALRHDVAWTLVLGEYIPDIEIDFKGRVSIEYTNASATAEAEFDEDEAGYSDDEVAALVAQQEQDAVEAKARAEEQPRLHEIRMREMRAARRAEVATTENAHPYLRQRALRILDGTEDVPTWLYYDSNADARAFYCANRILAGDIGEVRLPDGRHAQVWNNNIGGAKVDHLRENGMIAVFGEKGAREYLRPSELYDMLYAAEVQS
jgi:hypothetical protein